MNTPMLSALLACGVPADAPPALAPQPPQAAVVGMLEDAAADDDAAYRYSPVGKRDPFRAVIDTARRHVVEPAAYRVLGVVWQVDEPQALVVGADGRSFVVREGALLGESWGRVARISDEGVEVVTEYVSLSGEPVEQRTVLRLREG